MIPSHYSPGYKEFCLVWACLICQSCCTVCIYSTTTGGGCCAQKNSLISPEISRGLWKSTPYVPRIFLTWTSFCIYLPLVCFVQKLWGYPWLLSSTLIPEQSAFFKSNFGAWPLFVITMLGSLLISDLDCGSLSPPQIILSLPYYYYITPHIISVPPNTHSFPISPSMLNLNIFLSVLLIHLICVLPPHVGSNLGQMDSRDLCELWSLLIFQLVRIVPGKNIFQNNCF